MGKVTSEKFFRKLQKSLYLSTIAVRWKCLSNNTHLEETLFYFLALFFHPEDPLVNFEVHFLSRLNTITVHPCLGIVTTWVSLSKCSPRQEHIFLPWLAFCLPWHHPISVALHTPSIFFIFCIIRWHLSYFRIKEFVLFFKFDFTGF